MFANKGFIRNNKDKIKIKNLNCQISETSLPASDRYGFIPNLESRLTFQVDDKLMRRLEKYDIDTNPQNEMIRFVPFLKKIISHYALDILARQ
jgi:hypothetical protein